MRRAILASVILGFSLRVLAVTATQTVTVTIDPAYPDRIIAPAHLNITVARLSFATSGKLTITYTTDHTNRDIQVGVQSITGTVPTGFVLKISTNGTDWAELDLEGPLYEAVRLYTDIAPGQDQTRDVYLMVDASGVTDRSFVGATFTITLVYTLAQLD